VWLGQGRVAKTSRKEKPKNSVEGTRMTQGTTKPTVEGRGDLERAAKSKLIPGECHWLGWVVDCRAVGRARPVGGWKAKQRRFHFVCVAFQKKVTN
jgi:hypothetical protein